MGTLQPGSLRSTYCHTRVGFEVRNNFAIESHKHSAECAPVALTMLSPAHKGHLRLGRKKGQEGRNRHSCTGQPRRPVVAWDSAEFLSACKLPCKAAPTSSLFFPAGLGVGVLSMGVTWPFKFNIQVNQG